MISAQNKQMAQCFESMTERMSRPGLDLATIRDVYENLHLAATEPEGVCYADVNIDGVPALWCLPTDCDVNRVLLHARGKRLFAPGFLNHHLTADGRMSTIAQKPRVERLLWKKER